MCMIAHSLDAHISAVQQVVEAHTLDRPTAAMVRSGSFTNIIMPLGQPRQEAQPFKRAKSWGVGGAILSKASVNVALGGLHIQSSSSLRSRIGKVLSSQWMHDTVVVTTITSFFSIALVRF